MGGPVELEFAIVIPERQQQRPHLSILQIRPMGTAEETIRVNINPTELESIFCYSHQALGNSIKNDIHDILFVKPDTFDPSKTVEIAREISMFNGIINEAGRKYLLIGPGRWGSADRWLGIPVSWSDISSVGGIVETFHPRINAEPSQGSHFFHNITSLGINYLTVTGTKTDFIDWPWLQSLERTAETTYIGHVNRAAPFVMRVDGRSNRGALYR